MSSARENSATLDPREVDQFALIAAEWWDENGKFRPLHKIGPARLGYLRGELVRHFKRDPSSLRPFDGLSILDVGCGGGLISEPLAKLGASVMGLDPAKENIEAARRHAAETGTSVTYRAARTEDLVAEEARFDAVLCLEVVEHVPDVLAFLAETAKLVRPGGLMLLSTLNRTLKSYALAILGAEYILRWLPVGTHQWERFVTPEELAGYCTRAGLRQPAFEGLVYNPLSDVWSLSTDTGVNYFASAAKSA
jgi:2-polyprenyl-6-hydroxyphenyl methylase / 3-demethylubiquinone-9 3-methyltransferase